MYRQSSYALREEDRSGPAFFPGLWTRPRDRSHALLFRVAERLSRFGPLSEALEDVLALLCRDLGFSCAAVQLFEGETDRVRFQATVGRRAVCRSGDFLFPGRALIRAARESGRPRFTAPISREEIYLLQAGALSLDGDPSPVQFCVPILFRGRVEGVVSVAALYDAEDPVCQDIERVAAVACLLAPHVAAGADGWDPVSLPAPPLPSVPSLPPGSGGRAGPPQSTDGALTVLAPVRGTGAVPVPALPSGAPSGPVSGPACMLGTAPAMTHLFRLIEKVAPAPTTVLILGESGVGKERVARAIHEGGRNPDAPFVAVNCAALPESVLESELFGHEKGSFTGAVATRKGLFERAHGGTLFLDEIGDLGFLMQAKLLRALQEKTIERVGGTRPVEVDVRVLAATNRDLERMVAEGTFREDLFFRLNVFPITVCPLRERREDILPLAGSILRRFARSHGKPALSVSRAAQDLLVQHHWPGNVRELENVLERAVILCDGPEIGPGDLLLFSGSAGSGPGSGPGNGLPAPALSGSRLADLERSALVDALTRSRGNVTRAAALLQVTRRAFSLRLKKYAIDYRLFRI
ncbi:sigma-54-dependent Fis family transcriptional regulator [Phaeovibrio sulfidiphilus]|uniref:Sigma-54-dependent Fis family transcriptional regulator n=1 Tax=Phaeovibrio sulfidiphilus TaxID=1220600 RepID=A0A8J6YML8_9PROT|nr:sigma-54 dependent transcriptional regulator [Phaeovibrio sulfidiphilus]MBE1237375.1 sigma-54-dependent Fis family transcriptional regulator [Phaeovibrio sulfidiphilus]